jgi:hypothetical protein
MIEALGDSFAQLHKKLLAQKKAASEPKSAQKKRKQDETSTQRESAIELVFHFLKK